MDLCMLSIWKDFLVNNSDSLSSGTITSMSDWHNMYFLPVYQDPQKHDKQSGKKRINHRGESLPFPNTRFNSRKAVATSLTVLTTSWKKNKVVSDHSIAARELVQRYTSLHPVSVPPADSSEPQFDQWAVSSDSVAFSAVLSSHEDAVTTSLSVQVMCICSAS